MSGYTSGKTHHDPMPWINGAQLRGRRPFHIVGAYPHIEPVYDPRPEFDNHNPILVWLRAIWEDPNCGTHTEILDYLLNDPRMIDSRRSDFTPERIDHARRVLTKLAALTTTNGVTD